GRSGRLGVGRSRLGRIPDGAIEDRRAVCEPGRSPQKDELTGLASDSTIVQAVSADGKLVFVSVYSHDWSGVVEISRTDSHVVRIRAFADPANDQVLGAQFDGRWLVWSETHTMSSC